LKENTNLVSKMNFLKPAYHNAPEGLNFHHMVDTKPQCTTGMKRKMENQGKGYQELKTCFIIFLVVLGFELNTSHLLDRSFTA
jgi:hypothetical protein